MSSPTSHLACPQLALLNQAIATHPCTLGTVNTVICRCPLVSGKRGRRAHISACPPCSLLSLTRLHSQPGTVIFSLSLQLFHTLQFSRSRYSSTLPDSNHLLLRQRESPGARTRSGGWGLPGQGTALRPGWPMGGSNAASQLHDVLLPEVPRARPLAAFFFPSSEPIPIALALGHFFYSPHHQVDDKNHFRDPHAHFIHSRT